MCGRFSLADPKAIMSLMRDLAINIPIVERFNIAPTQMVPVVLNDGKRELSLARWGLIPSWAKDVTIGQKLFNARAETLAEKPSFKNSLKRRRCLIFADGFYEWTSMPGKAKKIPIRVTLKDSLPFVFAGLWDVWNDPAGGELISTTIITTTPNELMAKFHHRMPVILPKEQIDDWLDPTEVAPENLLPMLKQYPAAKMLARPVSSAVNSAYIDDDSCLAPYADIMPLNLFSDKIESACTPHSFAGRD